VSVSLLLSPPGEAPYDTIFSSPSICYWLPGFFTQGAVLRPPELKLAHQSPESSVPPVISSLVPVPPVPVASPCA